ncbi:hypothetical protein GF391_00710 [Candidatus Uhrbacteria bacterium]|nr:hypothetical protein [Candidatus Uhrbacteria bacterium]
MQTSEKKYQVFHAPELHMGEFANWQKSMPVLTEAVNALRTDGQVQILQYIVVSLDDEDDEDVYKNPHYRETVTFKYFELCEMFAMPGEALDVTVKSIQDTYCVITITRRLDGENRIPA